MSELLQASGYAALVYLLLNYFISFGSGRPLVEAINPNRRYLPLFAIGMFGIAYSLLLKGVWKHHATHLELLHQLVNEEKAQAEIVGAVSFVVFGVSVAMLYVWCVWNLPRDPRTFSMNPKSLVHEYHKAIRHYVRWKGGLDYAFLGQVKEGVHVIVTDAAAMKDVYRGITRLPAVDVAEAEKDPQAAVEKQLQIWREEAARIAGEWPRLEALTSYVRQGPIVTFCFDVRYGACYIEMLESPSGPAEKQSFTYLFGAVLNQHEVNTLTTGRHFYALAEAIRTIRRGVVKP